MWLTCHICHALAKTGSRKFTFLFLGHGGGAESSPAPRRLQRVGGERWLQERIHGRGWSFQIKPSQTQHLLWCDGAYHPVHVQHHPLPAYRSVNVRCWDTGSGVTRSVFTACVWWCNACECVLQVLSLVMLDFSKDCSCWLWPISSSPWPSCRSALSPLTEQCRGAELTVSFSVCSLY